MNVAIYTRIAQPNRAAQSEQAEDCRRYAHDHRLTVDAAFHDAGRPRDGLAQMLDAAVQGQFTDLVVTNVARLGVVLSDNIHVLEQLDQAGITVHTVDGNAVPSASEYAIKAMLAYAAADDERVTAATGG